MSRSLIIKDARILDPSTGLDENADICIEDGCIKAIAKDADPDLYDEVIDAEGLVAAPGLVDVHTHFRDPGQTAKETLHTGALAAAAGGYTSVVCMANTVPAVDEPGILKDILERVAKEKIHIYQTAAVTVGREGIRLTDMATLKASGAAGFTDDGTAIADGKLAEQAMKEAAALDAVLSFHEEDPAFVYEAGVNSGRIAETLGLKGADRRAEYQMIERDLKLALKTGAKTDIQHVSAKESVDVIRRYKAEDDRGLIHAEVTPHHFSLTEDMILKKGSLAKVNPPLRTEEDRRALIEGIKDGTLDLIATDHAPHTAEEKERELKEAPSGMTGLETALALGITNLVDPGHISLNKLIELMSCAPAGLYGLAAGSLSVGSPADVVLFDPSEEWIVKAEKMKSRSKNSPFIGQKLKGKIRYTIADGKIIYKDR